MAKTINYTTKNLRDRDLRKTVRFRTDIAGNGLKYIRGIFFKFKCKLDRDNSPRISNLETKEFNIASELDSSNKKLIITENITDNVCEELSFSVQNMLDFCYKQETDNGQFNVYNAKVILSNKLIIKSSGHFKKPEEENKIIDITVEQNPASKHIMLDSYYYGVIIFRNSLIFPIVSIYDSADSIMENLFQDTFKDSVDNEEFTNFIDTIIFDVKDNKYSNLQLMVNKGCKLNSTRKTILVEKHDGIDSMDINKKVDEILECRSGEIRERNKYSYDCISYNYETKELYIANQKIATIGDNIFDCNFIELTPSELNDIEKLPTPAKNYFNITKMQFGINLDKLDYFKTDNDKILCFSATHEYDKFKIYIIYDDNGENSYELHITEKYSPELNIKHITYIFAKNCKYINSTIVSSYQNDKLKNVCSSHFCSGGNLFNITVYTNQIKLESPEISFVYNINDKKFESFDSNFFSQYSSSIELRGIFSIPFIHNINELDKLVNIHI